MIAASAGVKIMVATKPVDFRKGADGLVALVREQLCHDPFAGTIFVFRSKRADRLKIFGLGRIRTGPAVETSGAWCVPMATDQRWRDATERIAACRADGRPGLVAFACPRRCAADRDIMRAATD